MSVQISRNRYSVVFAFFCFFLIASFFVRTALFVMSFSSMDNGLAPFVKIYGEGIVFDIGVALFFTLGYSIYLLLLPRKLNGSLFNKIFTWFFTSLAILVIMFSFFAEFTFWKEFESRFNFIAVDYLVYTYEVINNIRQSYPMPLLIGGMLVLTAAVLWIFHRKKVFSGSFNSHTSFEQRMLFTGTMICLSLVYGLFVNNSWADNGTNRYSNELAKAGIYSFFAAFKNNELSYEHFYPLVNRAEAFSIVRKEVMEPDAAFVGNGLSIKRNIDHEGEQQKPNVIMITIESFSADFMKYFGNTQNLTPTLDSLALKSVLFSNLYATGTRTVRGMEALSLSIPPTPGNSIVRRPDNDNLLTVGNIFKNAGYERSFIYGGDGYFDNMNNFFGSNGFNIIDRGKSFLKMEDGNTRHTIIPDSLVHFSNAWGVSDEDLYDAVVADADHKYQQGKRFYDFVMTTSNHRPFTYPSGKIDIPSGTGREGAVKYTDYAVSRLLEKIKHKPWYKNTVLVFVADHCASSAGKNEIDISKYHIPCMIVNLENVPGQVVSKMCSQIDLYPTLFKMLGWNYESNLYGKDVLNKDYTPRVVLGTYQKLAFMENDSLVILSPQRPAETYLYRKDSNEQVPNQLSSEIVREAISEYQTAYYSYKNGGLKQ